ncbi:MAG: bifunctional 3-deoxy-7-phosphoheptulonate synthase/chorismate mutase type II [Bacteroidales bacterium]|nr:bifunctional 3-deoxy-7-phosphoheptulonate synthase/chorismate mutase type II [Bacteroidales bacterium]
MSINLDILPLKEWLDIKEFPLVISGPCSAESEEQVLITARKISKIPNVKIFRAGIWKPRTRPGLFEGVGIKGLQWLKKVKKETGLLTAVEVALPEHVDIALNNNVDILWIGARTVVNPFSLQDLASVLKGVDIPVMIKNPVNPDLNLWIGALERINLSGIKRLVAIHRGFYFFDKTPYRNAPMWEIPIELKRLIPNLPVICDPSHICGKQNLLLEISQKALDLEMNGLMIESHYDPDNALTDPQQQITPENLSRLISSLIIRKEKGNIDFESKLEELRTEIDKIDAELINILSRRMGLIDEIGKYKRDHNITILQLKRWSQIVQDRLKTGLDSGLKKEFLQKLLKIVHIESIQRQTEIYSKKNNHNESQK